jgi:hypothetical protein
MNQLPINADSHVLNSWKEIATYFGRGVRTVQRWEQELQLPVHRIGIGTRSPVFAFEHELRGWLHATNPASLSFPAPALSLEACEARALVVCRSIELASRIVWTAQENRRLMAELARTLERLQLARTKAREGRITRVRGRAETAAPLLARALQRKGAVPAVLGAVPNERYVTAAH